jgi:hypothetical protein
MVDVLNIYTATKAERSGAVYIGRRSRWGNPFVIGPDGTRAEVIAKYREWLASQPELVEAARQKLAGKNLMCHCTPLPCHGDVLAELVNPREESR